MPDKPDKPGRADAGADKPLFVALARGKDVAAEELWARHAPRLIAYARVILAGSGDQAHAEDVVQQVFLSVVRMTPKRAREVRHPVSWLLTATRSAALNTARGERRERRRRSAAEPRLSGPPADHEFLRGLVERLPTQEAEIVVLRHAYGFGYETLGEVLGLPRSTAASKHNRAIRRLRGMLADETGHPETRETGEAAGNRREARRA